MVLAVAVIWDIKVNKYQVLVVTVETESVIFCDEVPLVVHLTTPPFEKSPPQYPSNPKEFDNLPKTGTCWLRFGRASNFTQTWIVFWVVVDNDNDELFGILIVLLVPFKSNIPPSVALQVAPFIVALLPLPVSSVQVPLT